MAYFNHAFQKMFLGTAGSSGNLDEGWVNVAAETSASLYANYGVGAFALLNPTTYETLSAGNLNSYTGSVILAGTSLYQNDKIGPFAGGYQETSKSKMINPKYVSKVYTVEPCAANANIIHIGKTAYTDDAGTAYCCHDFYCDKTYYLRVDVKGSPVLRYLTRNAYWTADYNTGCCPDPTTPTTVDPFYVMRGWAIGLMGQGVFGEPNYIPNKIVGPFISIYLTSSNGDTWVQPGTSEAGHTGNWGDYDAVTNPTGYVSTWDGTTDSCASSPALGAGMTITGAYVDTVFGNCTFYPSDFFQKEPVHIYASEVDMLGDPCVYTGICVAEECCPRQAQGFGETVLRELILSESYAQNYFYTGKDLRIREITQGYDVSDAVTRSAQYWRTCILHSVPRFNNPTGVFDNDQYLLTIVTPNNPAVFIAALNDWLNNCNCNVQVEESINNCGADCPSVSP
jgi:hypothetical protein